jgi:hypothetical protein
MNLRFDALFQNYLAARQDLFGCAKATRASSIDDLEFLLDAERENMALSPHVV